MSTCDRGLVVKSGDLSSCFEDASTRLASSPVLANVLDIDDADFGRILIQRRFVSLAFTPFYDMLIDGLENPRARLVCRQILREEYPDPAGNSPSHRELLVQDMVAFGLDRTALLGARPTPATVAAIAASIDLVWSAMAAPFPQLALITTACCYAESLVAAEYRALEPRIERVLPLRLSVFYGPHLLHDNGHSKRLLEEVALSLDEGDPLQLKSCIDAVDRCVSAKLAFYDQFAKE